MLSNKNHVEAITSRWVLFDKTRVESYLFPGGARSVELCLYDITFQAMIGTWINHVTTVKNCFPKIVP